MASRAALFSCQRQHPVAQGTHAGIGPKYITDDTLDLDAVDRLALARRRTSVVLVWLSQVRTSHKSTQRLLCYP